MILVGDANANMDDFDKYAYYDGSPVLDPCDEKNLIAVNRDIRPDGLVRWQLGNRESCIDYALVSGMICKQLGQKIIAEHCKNSLGSFHRRLTLKFETDTNTKHKPITLKFLKIYEEQTIEIAKYIEKEMEAFSTAVLEYKKLVDVMQQEIKKTQQKK